jgi:hypothetical protein
LGKYISSNLEMLIFVTVIHDELVKNLLFSHFRAGGR